ncbi:DUF916 domain-containing protein [Microbacterium sp. NPDC077663]|uniref:DUF916 domain-containing protein n=1 Tax=Microbacterium sp. NPDC077663 TaxID=3364189 RepID=UPI0037C79E39
MPLSFPAAVATPLLAAGLLVLASPSIAMADTATQDVVGWTVETADNDLGSGRGNFGYDVAPGEVIRDSMIVVNTGTVELPLDVYAADAFTTSGGDVDVLLDGTTSEGAGTWVEIEKSSVRLSPGAHTEIDFTITVPNDARPGDHAAGIVTSLVTSDASQTLAVDRRLGTRINARVAGALIPSAQITQATASYEPSWNPFDTGVVTVTYALENTGNTRITGVEKVSVAGPLGLLGTDAGTAGLPEVIPGSTVEMQRTIEATSIGWLSTTLTVRPEGIGLGAGAVAPISVDVAFPAVPWSLYALLVGAVALVGVVLLVALRRQRARAAKSMAEAVPHDE